MEKIIEKHPLEPFLPQNTKLLMLGSFPPKQERWCMNFYYPNFQNDMWRILGSIFFGNKEYFIIRDEKKFDSEKIKSFLYAKGIGIGDTAQRVIRHKDNASDIDLEVVEPTDLKSLFKLIPECKAIVTTGQKATDTLKSNFSVEDPKIGNFSEFKIDNKEMLLFRMPSSSRAYPKPLDAKIAIYRTMFEHLGML